MVSWKGVGALFGILLVLGVMIALFSNSPQNTVKVIDDPANYTNMVRINANGFAPETLTIRQGESVVFVNTDSEGAHWPASNNHPTHTNYPDSGIEKCGTDEASDIFDACHGLEQGETYHFAFNEVGTWEYHDHLNPFLTGTIVVE